MSRYYVVALTFLAVLCIGIIFINQYSLYTTSKVTLPLPLQYERLDINVDYEVSSNCTEELVKANPNKITIPEWNFGRLGNTIMSATHAIAYSLRHNCALLLPSELIGLNNYSSPQRYFCSSKSANDTRSNYRANMFTFGRKKQRSRNGVCDISRPSKYWWSANVKFADHPSVLERLRIYLGFNETHSLGHKCQESSNSTAYLGLHIRSGDIFRGYHNSTTGHWQSEPVNSFYMQPPLAYYLNAVRAFRERCRKSKRKAIIKVACEDALNPVCEIFQVLALSDPSIQMEITDLLQTLRTMACCDEIVLSKSTLSTVFTLSTRLKHIHFYGHRQNCSKDSEPSFAHMNVDTTAYYLPDYRFTSWSNTEMQRSQMLKPYKGWSRTCPSSTKA